MNEDLKLSLGESVDYGKFFIKVPKVYLTQSKKEFGFFANNKTCIKLLN